MPYQIKELEDPNFVDYPHTKLNDSKELNNFCHIIDE